MANRSIWAAVLVLTGCFTGRPGLDPDLGVVVDGAVAGDAESGDLGFDSEIADGAAPLDGASGDGASGDGALERDAAEPLDGRVDGGAPDAGVGARSSLCVGVEASPVPAAATPTSVDLLDEVFVMAPEPTVVDLNCDGRDDLLVAVPARGTVYILYGSPGGLFAGRTLPLVVGEPVRTAVADFNGQPGPELVVLGQDRTRWKVWAYDVVAGVPVPLAEREITEIYIVPPGDTPLILQPAQLDRDAPSELVVGSLAHLRPWRLEWTPAGVALSTIDPELPPRAGRNGHNSSKIYPVPAADGGPDGLLGVEENGVVYWTHDGAGYLLDSSEFWEGPPNRNLRDFAVLDVDAQGFPTPIGTHLRDGIDAEAIQPLPGRGPMGQTLFRRLPIPEMTVSQMDGVLDGIEVARFRGGPAPEVLLLDRRAEDPPSILAVLTDVTAFEGRLGPVGGVFEYRFPDGLMPDGLVLGDFDGDGGREAIVYDFDRALRCLRLSPEAPPVTPCD